MNGKSFRGRPGPTRGCRTSDDDDDEEEEDEPGGKRKTRAPYLVFQAAPPNNKNYAITLAVCYKLRSSFLSYFLCSFSHRAADVTMYVNVTTYTLCGHSQKYAPVSPWS